MRCVAIPAGRFDWDVYVDELGAERIAELEALWAVEPWGDERADRRAEAHTRILAAAFGNSTPIDDCLFDYLELRDAEEETDPETSAAIVRGVLHGAQEQ